MATEQAEPEIGLDREKARKAHLQVDGHDVVSIEITGDTAWVIVFNQNPDSPIVWQGQIKLDAPRPGHTCNDIHPTSVAECRACAAEAQAQGVLNSPAGELSSDEILAFDRKVQEEGR